MNRFIAVITSLAPILIICLSISCGGISAKERSAMDAAIKALRKIEAATQVGVNYQQYGQLLIDAKTQVNEASAVLSDNKLKQDINWVMDAYADAGTVWGKKIKGSYSLYDDEVSDKILITKYSLKTVKDLIKFLNKELVKADIEESMQEIWRQAAQRLNEITNASKK